MTSRGLCFDETITSKVVDYLKYQILVSKSYKKGDKIIESQIAKKLNVSRSPVREAIHRLESQGLVTTIPHKGAFVSAFSMKEMEEIYELRYLFEGNIYEILIKNKLLKEADFKYLVSLVDQMVEVARSEVSTDEKIPTFLKKDIKFHRYTWLKAERPRTLRILSDLYHQLELGMLDDLAHEKNLEAAASSHYKILECLKSGDLEKLRQIRSWSLFARRLENIKEV